MTYTMKGLKFEIIISLFFFILTLHVSAQSRSLKRGIGWDEKTQKISDAPIEKMLSGVSWFYNWGPAPSGNAARLGAENGMDFAPMCWNGNYNEATIRQYVTSHKGVKYLLGFNEPNFSAQANMTPSAAAGQWPRLEKLAADLGLKLVAPALNFTGEKVGGRIWSPYEWLDEFIKQYKSQNGRLPKMDCLALHCYMNWYGSSTWFTTEYFYKDLYVVNPTNNVVGKYPNIVDFLDTYKAANGHFPRMMLTEFCSWEGDKDGFVTNLDNQIDQMTQKIQMMEQSDLVEGYAWFMANANGGINEFPYMSVFQTNTADSELSALGKVYVNMSSFDISRYYLPGETIQAKDYVDATRDNYVVKVRANTEAGSTLPLQIELQNGSYPTYQIETAEAGEYKVTFHLKSAKASPIWFYVDGKPSVKAAGVATGNAWTDYEIKTNITAGKHTVYIYNAGSSSIFLNSWKYEPTTNGIDGVNADDKKCQTVYTVNGTMLGKGKIQDMNLAKGIYIVAQPTGEKIKTLIK